MAVGARKRVVPSAARTTTQTFGPFDFSGRTLRITVRSTAFAATPSVTPKIQSVGPGGTAVDVLTGVAITGNGEQVLTVGPDIAAAANSIALAYAPTRYQIVMTAGDADSLTYEIWEEKLK